MTNHENLVAVMLAANRRPLRYWMSRDANREIEFLAERGGKVEPIEVKAARIPPPERRAGALREAGFYGGGRISRSAS